MYPPPHMTHTHLKQLHFSSSLREKVVESIDLINISTNKQRVVIESSTYKQNSFLISVLSSVLPCSSALFHRHRHT
jgi:hypothetical protein